VLMRADDIAGEAREDLELTLVCCCDQEFAMPLAVLLCSASTNVSAPWRVRVCVIDGGIAPPTLDHLARTIDRLGNARLEIFKPDRDLQNDLRLDGRLDSSCYLRLLMGMVLPANIQKVIYLDCDMIVESDLAQLWRQSLGGAAVLAVRDFGYPTLRQGLPHTVDLLGCDGTDPYFNSGLMVVDLKRWREQRIGERVVEYTRRFFETVRFGDQDGLNAVLWNQWKAIDLAWNVQVGALTYLRTAGPWEDSEELVIRGDELLAHPRILHFVGGHKPWHGGRYKPVRGRFLRYLHQSRWFGPLGIARFHATWFAKTSQMAVSRLYQYLNPAAGN
jgi:lipopolysaccharide biosynthesis glycosyltransferase